LISRFHILHVEYYNVVSTSPKRTCYSNYMYTHASLRRNLVRGAI